MTKDEILEDGFVEIPTCMTNTIQRQMHYVNEASKAAGALRSEIEEAYRRLSERANDLSVMLSDIGVDMSSFDLNSSMCQLQKIEDSLFIKVENPSREGHSEETA